MHPIRHTQPNRRETLLALIGAALLPACGGGTDIAGLSSGGTGSFTTGTIVGLGSVIVNGIRYDDSAAAILVNGASGQPGDLKLGMVVRIRGSAVSASSVPGEPGTATASQIDCSSEWKAVAQSVNTTARTFTLLGQTVRVLATTVFDTGQLADLSNQPVQVYGFIDPSDNSLIATRVERSTSPLERYRLSGTVRSTTASTFELGSATIAYASAGLLQQGQIVRAELQTAVNANGHWVATEVQVEDFSSELEDDDEAEIEGNITAFSSAAAFNVGGIAVDARGITPPTGLALGVRVEVKGSIHNGSVVATEIEIPSDEDIEAQEYELHGAVSELDTVAKTFVIRGYSVRYDDQTAFDLGSATWADGLSVQINARLDAGGLLLATEIEVDD